MAPPKFDAEAWVDQAAPLLQLTIDPASRPGVVANLQRMAEIAAVVMAVELGDHDEAGPVFRP